VKYQGAVLALDILGEEKVAEFIKAARGVDIEAIVAVSQRTNKHKLPVV
jgi:indole-3-glycerol phosphate synthase